MAIAPPSSPSGGAIFFPILRRPVPLRLVGRLVG